MSTKNRSLVRVGVREFRDGLARYLDADAPVAITRHGQTVGYFIPASVSDRERELAALTQAVGELERLLAEHGIDPEEVAQEFRSRHGSS